MNGWILWEIERIGEEGMGVKGYGGWDVMMLGEGVGV